MNIKDFEIFQFAENSYTPFSNNGNSYLLRNKTYLDIVLTDHCNSNCNFCIADLIHEKLTCNLDAFKSKILYAIENLNVKEVLLLGGEPTCYNKLIEMIQWFSTLGLDKIVMTTNGYRLKDYEYLKRIAESGLTHINLSLMSLEKETQKKISNSNNYIDTGDLYTIFQTLKKNNIKLRINSNVFKGNNDHLFDIVIFYEIVKQYCNSVKISPLLRVDDFSVVNVKTEWANKYILSAAEYEAIFDELQVYFAQRYRIGTIENDLQFGFVKNTMIPLKTPILLNWNFGTYTGMMDKVIKERKINNIKLLPNNELSLSWNRELTEYFINTD